MGGTGRIRYSGAPEPTDYDEVRSGFALLVDLTPEKCEVRELPVAKWKFARETFELSGDEDIPRLRAWFDGLTSKENVIAKIGLKGALSLQGHVELARFLEEARQLLGGLEAWERESQLVVRPTAADLDALGLTGYAHAALEDVQAMVDGDAGGIQSSEAGERSSTSLPSRPSPADWKGRGVAVRILDLQLKDFKGVTNGRVQPRPSGITIIVGPNEVGKSSLLEGFDFLLNELDSSLKREVKESKPVGRDEGPSVEAEIEAGTYRFRVRKRWLRRPETELRVSRPRAEVKTGREAHERMREILESAVDIELLGAVRYLQGASVGPPPLPTRGLLTEALDKATGGASNTEESASLFEAAQEEYRKYFTASDKEVRAFQDLQKQASALEIRVTELQAEAVKAQEEADRYERLSGELDALRHRLLTLESDQKSWGERLQAVKRIEDRTKVAAAEFEAARERHTRAVAAAGARAELAHQVEVLLRDVDGLNAAYDGELPELERAKERSLRAEEASVNAEQGMEDAERVANLTKNDHELLRLQFDSQLLSERGRRAERALKDSLEAGQALATGGLSDEGLENLRELNTSLTVSQQKLEVASPTLSITALTDLRPVVGGEPMALKKGAVHQIPVPDSVIVEIPTRARLEIKPGMSLSKLQDSQRDARSAWEAALAKAGVGDLAKAVESNRSRNEATVRKKEAEKALRLALRTDDPEPFVNVEELLAKVSELRLRIQKLEKERPSSHPLPEKREVAERLAREAQQSLVAAQTRLKTSREIAKRARDDLGKRQVKEAELRSRRDQAAEMVENRQKGPQ